MIFVQLHELPKMNSEIVKFLCSWRR